MLDLDKKQIMALFDFDAAAKRIKKAYVASAQGEVQTGDVVHLAFPEAQGDCHVKSGHIAGTDTYVIKIASGFYDNPSKGLPSSNGMMLAFSATTGEPRAILRDEGWLTDMRTGIGGALATRALARADATEVLIIGDRRRHSGRASGDVPCKTDARAGVEFPHLGAQCRSRRGAHR